MSENRAIFTRMPAGRSSFALTRGVAVLAQSDLQTEKPGEKLRLPLQCPLLDQQIASALPVQHDALRFALDLQIVHPLQVLAVQRVCDAEQRSELADPIALLFL